MTKLIVQDSSAAYHALQRVMEEKKEPLYSILSGLTHDEFRELWLASDNGITIQIDTEILLAKIKKPL